MTARDDITYNTPGYEATAYEWAMDDSPLSLGETGAGFLVDPALCGDGFPRNECPNGPRCADRTAS
jgi:hypothetical protein